MYDFHIIHLQLFFFFSLRLFRLHLASLTPEKKNYKLIAIYSTKPFREKLFVVLITNISCVSLLYASLGVYDVDLLFCLRNNPRK